MGTMSRKTAAFIEHHPKLKWVLGQLHIHPETDVHMPAFSASKKLPTVAIFDDTQEIVDVFEKKLEGCAAFVNRYSVNSSRQALREFKNALPDVVIVDASLTRRSMRGKKELECFEILRGIRRIKPGTKVILDTTLHCSSDEAIRKRISDAGFDLVVGKGEVERIGKYIESLAQPQAAH